MLAFLPANLRNMHKLCASPFEARWGGTTCVRVEGSDKYSTVQATNGKVAVCSTIRDENHPYPGVEEIETYGGETLIAPNDWQKAFQMLSAFQKQSPAHSHLPLAIGQAGNTVKLATMNSFMAVPAQDEARFPNLEQVFDVGFPLVSVKVNPALLASVLNVLSDVCGDEKKCVELFICKNVIAIKHSSANQTTEALVVPFTEIEKKGC